MIEIESIALEKDSDMQLVLGHAGFIKTAEDLYEAVVGSVPNIKFGIAFAEASGPCLVRSEGNDDSLKKLAEANIMKIGAGHTFLILFKGAFPINVLNSIKLVPEVTRVYCATANPLQIIVAKTEAGKAVIGVVDGSVVKGVEKDEDVSKRRKFLRDIGYKK